jgi:hypothetical protein
MPSGFIFSDSAWNQVSLYQQISTESPVKRFMKSLYRHQPTPEEQHRLLAHVGQMISFGIRNGTPLGPILKETAERLTQEALFSTEKGLYIKQLAILLPLFLCILPAVFIVILTPLLIHLFLTPF